MHRALLLTGLWLLSVATQGATTAPDLDAALKLAAQQRSAVLVEFRAPWCYSCYYMAKHVHTGTEWTQLQQRAVLLEFDADSPQGAARMQQWNVKALPAYLLLDAEGVEIGRVLGEQTRADFYAAMDRLLQSGAGLADLQTQARQGGAAGAEAALAALQAFQARADADGGLQWFETLPPRLRQIDYPQRPALKAALARLQLMQSAAVPDGPGCTAAAEQVLDADLGCERPYELRRYLACLDAAADQGESASPTLLQAQRAQMETLVRERVLSADRGAVCADTRSAVLGLADLHQRLGQADAREAGLRRAVAHLRAQIGDDLGADRSAADNLRVFVEALEDHAAYDALMPHLIAQWPDDYVYPYRYGRHLLDRGEAEAALPYLEQASAQAYGENRLRVAELQVRALMALDRAADARKVAAQAFKANGPWFPERVAAVKAALKK
ncbi:thioredoxin family protein [Panacagrimonas sp.]|uniref:thioredoxin family protein n=1 Tax=Panacagrimonas sp. TaxID=2480088 RepID=UPI003B52AB79